MSVDVCAGCGAAEGVLLSPTGFWMCEPCAHAEGLEQCARCEEFHYTDALTYPEDGADAPLCRRCWTETEPEVTTGHWGDIPDEDEEDSPWN